MNIYAITLIADILSKSMSPEETAVAAAFFTQLGDTLATISVSGSRTDNIF